jgi:hypothetical protein
MAALCLCAALAWAQAQDPVSALVSHLNLESYKATIKGLTQFGDRRQGTDRNRAAVDWIEAQLKSYGCTNTERIHYEYSSAARAARPPAASPQVLGAGGSRLRGARAPTGVNNDAAKQPDEKLRQLNSQPTAPGPRIWTASAGAKPPTTTAREPRW